VVGGGVVGASAAYYLAGAGWRVTVLDRGRFGAGCSHANCGYVCPSHVLPLAGPGALWSTLKTLFRRNSPLKVRPGAVLRNPGWFLAFARRCNRPAMLAAGRALRALLASSRALYDELVRKERLDCGWEARGLLFVFRTAAGVAHHAGVDALLRAEFDTPARRLDADALLALEPALEPGAAAGGWLYEGDAHLRPDRLMAELRRVLLAHGVEVLEGREVTGFARDGGRARAVRTAGGEVEGDAFVLAAGAWTTRLAGELGCRVRILPGKGYSLTLPRPAVCPTYPMIFEEDRVAVTPFADGLRIGSTMEFAGYDETLNRDRLRLLTDAAAAYLRDPGGTAGEEWWGWRPMTPDGLPVIGPAPALANVVVAAGHGMLGVSMAPATGKLVAELLSGAAPHLDPAPYRISRP
jgi:D-amino-acid dehydrogenase